MYDYFYGAEADQFSFYRIPKVLFTEKRFQGISAEAKVLYGLLLDRMSLSARNGWLDEEGRVYIIFSIEDIMTSMGCANQKAAKLLYELESKCSLIERKRQGLGKPNLIYVKNFVTPSESHFKKCENHDSGSVKITSQESLKSHANNTENIITTAYLRNEDIQTAVEENIDYLNPPVRSVFVEFLTRIKLVDPDVDAALQDMGTKIDNAVFREWVAALLTCRHDRGLKTILTPIVAKLSDMRIVNGELENLVFEPRKEFITMQVLVIGNIPLLYWLNQDWYDVLMHTPLGQALLAAIAAVMFISTAAVIKLTQPIEYRR